MLTQIDEAVEAVEAVVFGESQHLHELPCVQEDAVDLHHQGHCGVADVSLRHQSDSKAHHYL